MTFQTVSEYSNKSSIELPAKTIELLEGQTATIGFKWCKKLEEI